LALLIKIGLKGAVFINYKGWGFPSLFYIKIFFLWKPAENIREPTSLILMLKSVYWKSQLKIFIPVMRKWILIFFVQSLRSS